MFLFKELIMAGYGKVPNRRKNDENGNRKKKK